MAKTNKNLVLGVDIGGSKINMVVWDGKKVVDNWQTKQVSLENLKKGILNFNIPKVGIGAAAVLDYKTGCILNSPNLRAFEGFCIKKILKRKIRFDNDVHCFLRAEAESGIAKDYKNVLAVAMGTGIGGAIMTNKKSVYWGSNGSLENLVLWFCKMGKHGKSCTRRIIIIIKSRINSCFGLC